MKKEQPAREGNMGNRQKPRLSRWVFLSLGALMQCPSASAISCPRLFSRMADAYHTVSRPAIWVADVISDTKAKLKATLVYRGTIKPLTWGINGLYRYQKGRESVPLHFWHESGFAAKGVRLIEDLANPSLRFLFPGLLNRLDSPTSAVFRKQWVDASYEPSANEKVLLEKYQAWDSYQAHGKFLRDHPTWTKSRRYLGTIGDLLFKGIWIAAINNVIQVAGAEDDCARDNQTYARDPKCAPAEDEVQLLIESVPFPHMAIRIGDKVYSYGVSHLQVSVAAQYVLSRDLAEIIAQNAADGDRQPREENTSSSFPIPSFFTEALKQRTIQVVTLKVGKNKRDEVRRYLELQAWKEYDNTTFVNDCATMTMRALGMENPLIDPSPSSLAMKFSLQKTLGSGNVSKVFLVKNSSLTSEPMVVARNTLINVWEASFNVRTWPISQPWRLKIDLTGSREDLQRHDGSTKKVIASWQEEVGDEFRSEPRIRMYDEWLAHLQEKNEFAVRERLKRLLQSRMDADFAKLIADEQDRVDNPEATLKSYWRGRFRLKLLQEHRDRFRHLLNSE